VSNRQTLRDAQYKAIGYIETDNDGAQVLLDAHYRRVGQYDPRANVTTDEHYRRVGEGNLLVSLLPIQR